MRSSDDVRRFCGGSELPAKWKLPCDTFLVSTPTNRKFHIMVLEIHVWGPGFGLPSVDPECIAIIAYAQQTLRDGAWAVVAAHDVSLSPNSACVSGD